MRKFDIFSGLQLKTLYWSVTLVSNIQLEGWLTVSLFLTFAYFCMSHIMTIVLLCCHPIALCISKNDISASVTYHIQRYNWVWCIARQVYPGVATLVVFTVTLRFILLQREYIDVPSACSLLLKYVCACHLIGCGVGRVLRYEGNFAYRVITYI